MRPIKESINISHPYLSSLLKEKTISSSLGKGSHTKVWWICPNCGNEIFYPVNKVCVYGYVPCKRCSDNVSYPNKLMYNILEQLGVDFITEYSPDWIKPKRYDFFLPSYNLIIEMDGALGHGHKTIGEISPTETLNTDNYKDRKCNEHNITMIRIDSYVSDLDYIKDNVFKSKLAEIFNLDKVDFLSCHKNALSSYKMKVCECWNKYKEISEIEKRYKFARITIIKWLKDCAKYNLCDYDPKKQQTRSGKRNISKAYSANRKKVICLETKQIFDSCREAYKWLGYNIDGHSIQDNCKGITLSAGKHPTTKEKLHWAFYENYPLVEEELLCRIGI